MAISLLRMAKRRRLAAEKDEDDEERRRRTLVLAMVAAFSLSRSTRPYADRQWTYTRYNALRTTFNQPSSEAWWPQIGTKNTVLSDSATSSW